MNPRARPLWLFLALAWLGFSALSVVSCLDALGIQTLTESQCGKAAHAPPACDDCLGASCCAAGRACDADPACHTLEVCLGACALDQPLCRRDCALANPDGAALASAEALDACKRGACAKACLGAGGLAALGPTPACVACFEPCEAQFGLGCIEDAACETFAVCMISATNPTERLACDAKVDFTIPASAETLMDCTLSCSSACGFTNGFGCVGQFSWPVSGPPLIDYTVTTSDFFGNAVEGAQIIACDRTLCATCDEANALATGATGADGAATLALPRGWTGCLSLRAPENVPMLAYPSAPPNAVSQFRTRVITEAIGAQVVQNLGEPYDPTKGVLLALQHDCLYDVGVEVVFEVDGAGSAWGYGANFQPALTSGSQAVRANLEPGPHTLTARRADTGEEVASEFVVLLPGTLTVVSLYPKRL